MRDLLDARIDRADSILLAGCGGGYDVLSAVPLAIDALSRGKRVTFGSLSFSDLAGHEGAERVGPTGILVSADLGENAYFPELVLRRWLDARGVASAVVAYPVGAPRDVADTLRATCARWDVDTVVLVDGGTDALIKGDEHGLGTVVEDAISVVAAAGLATRSSSVACLGFGVDHHHGVSHHSFLENAAEAIRRGGFLGTSSLLAGTPEGDAFLDLVGHANASSPSQPSIVANCVADAVRGRFGDHHALARTRGSELFVNPLMSLYWSFDLGTVFDMMGFATEVGLADDVDGVVAAVAGHHARQHGRPFRPIPL